jgi:signal transduction histidine kinase
MRWPLRNQILLRIFLLLVVTIGTITWLLIQNRVASSRKTEMQKLDQITEMIAKFPFPKSNAVLQAMKSLSGAEFVVRSGDGAIRFSTSNAPNVKVSPAPKKPVRISDENDIWYFTVADDPSSPGAVSVFLPVESESQIFWRVGRTPLLVAALALPLAMILGWLFSSQITRPLASLCKKTDKLASGTSISNSFAKRDDEIGDLYRTMNEMAQRIHENESRLRKSERASALVDVGNGIAHNIGNSAAGCQMALQLMASSNKDVEQSQEYQVALRQLGLMSSYIKRFLSLSKQTGEQSAVPSNPVELKAIFDQSTELLMPMARHLDVEFRIGQVDTCEVLIDEDDARQVFLNLIINAIHAAKKRSVQKGDSNATVSTSLAVDNNRATFTVEDNGSGPPAEIAERIFEPFVSKGGTGLGLAMVREIADNSGGAVSWKHHDDLTTFTFEFKRD